SGRRVGLSTVTRWGGSRSVPGLWRQGSRVMSLLLTIRISHGSPSNSQPGLVELLRPYQSSVVRVRALDGLATLADPAARRARGGEAEDEQGEAAADGAADEGGAGFGAAVEGDDGGDADADECQARQDDQDR